MNAQKAKGVSNEKLPDPRSAITELEEGSPRTRTAAHLKRLLAASLTAPLVAGLTSCGYFVVDPIPPPRVISQGLGSVALESPESAFIEIDGTNATLMKPHTLTALGAGTHRIQLTTASSPATFIVDIVIGTQSSPSPATPLSVFGALKLMSPAQMQIDGAPATRVTPEDRIQLNAGSHKIELSPLSPAVTLAFTLEILSPKAESRD